jgi:hypothetical protein
METLHLLLGRSVVFFFLICGVWGLLGHFKKLPVDGRYYSTLVLAELLVVAQAALGIVLVLLGRSPLSELHFLYGGLSVVLLPVAYNYATQRRWSAPLVCGLTTLFIFGLAIRAFTTTAIGFGGLFGAIPR